MSERDESYARFLETRRREICDMIGAAAARAGRDAAGVSAIAVSKTVGFDEVLLARRAGWDAFGENRPQELVRKLEAAAASPEMAGARFDMIGNLQKNKINAVLGRAACIHSMSSLHLAEAVSTRAERRIAEGELAAPQPVLLEVNISGEVSKSGFTADELRESFPRLRELRGIRIQGLMTMAPQGDKTVARNTFRGLRELRDELSSAYPDVDLTELSCGMSEDFEQAILEGSTLVRLGRVVFDPSFELK